MPQAASVAALIVVSIALVLAPAAQVSATDWSVTPDGPGGRCGLVSSRQPMPDGYQQTTVYFFVTPRSLALISAAPLDAGAGDIGVTVDDEPFVKMDRLDGDKTAVFESSAETLIARFKAGKKVRVQLRFWPTWPATGAHDGTLSLIGFTKGYGQLSECR